MGTGRRKTEELLELRWWISGDVLVMILWNNLFRSSLLANERFVDVRNDTTTGDGRLDQAIEFFVSTNSELKMARCDTFDFQVFWSVACQLENLKMNKTKKTPVKICQRSICSKTSLDLSRKKQTKNIFAKNETIPIRVRIRRQRRRHVNDRESKE